MSNIETLADLAKALRSTADDGPKASDAPLIRYTADVIEALSERAEPAGKPCRGCENVSINGDCLDPECKKLDEWTHARQAKKAAPAPAHWDDDSEDPDLLF